MHIAAYFDSLECLIFLRRCGWPLNMPSSNAYRPIHYACVNGSYECTSYILSQDPSQAKDNAETNHGIVYLATWSSKPKILKMVLMNGADLKSQITLNDKPMTRAIETRSVDCLKLLLKYKCPIQIEHKFYTPVMLAIVHGMFDAVPLLVEAGQKPDEVTEIPNQNSDNLSFVMSSHETALSLACKQNSLKTVKYLCSKMDKVDLNENINDAAAVHWICSTGNPEIVGTVLDKGINVNRLDGNGRSFAHYLISGAHDSSSMINILEQLLTKGLDLNLLCKSPNGELHNSILSEFVTAIDKFPQVIKWLLNHGADPNVPVFLPKTVVPLISYVHNLSDSRIEKIFREYQDATNRS